MPIWIVVLGLWLGIVPAAIVAAPAANAPPGKNILLITVDTLRADHLGCYGYKRIKTPHMDQLAREGVQFDQAFAQVPLTLPSHVVILSGTYPMYNTVRDFTGVGLPRNVGLVSEALERQGYATSAFVSAMVLDGFWGLRRGFEIYDSVAGPDQFESGGRTNLERRAQQTVDRFLSWFAARPAKPFFAWLHLYDPHSPYNPPAPFSSEYAGRLYDGEIAYCDQQLGQVFSALRKANVYDSTVVVLLSDHGESLGEHGEDEHGLFLYSSTLRVPLLIKTAGAPVPKGRVVNTVVGTIDVPPTILQLAGVTDGLSRQFQGRSLVPLMLGPARNSERSAYAETYYPKNSFGWSPLHALISPNYSYIDAPKPELYARTKDPGEKINVYSEQRFEANGLKTRLDDLVRRYTNKSAETARTPPSEDTLEKLRSLGYLAYKAPAAAARDGGSLPDPKDKTHTHRAILRATALSEAGRLNESDRVLRELAGSEPKLYAIPFMLGENAYRQRRMKEAQRQFLACLELSPGFSPALIGAARAYHADRQNEKAKPLLDLALRDNPGNFLAAYALGVMANEEGNFADATKYFTSVIRDRPDFAQAFEGLGIAQVESGEYRKALSNLERARALGSLNPALLNYQAVALGYVGNFNTAIQLYRQALELKPDYGAARLNLAMAYRKIGDREAARREFKLLCDSGSALCRQYRSAFESAPE